MAAVLKIKDALGNVYEIPGIKGVGVAALAVVEDGGSYKLRYTLTDGTEGEAGVLPNAAPVEAHTHGNLTYDGRLGSTEGLTVETGAGGTLRAGRRILAGTTPPEEVTGLSAGDIYLYYRE